MAETDYQKAIAKAEKIHLDGTIIKSDGTSYKSNFFKFLDIPLDDYSNVSYTPEEAHAIRAHLSALSTGSAAAVPLICGGPAKCPWADICKFVQLDKERKAENPNAKLITPLGKRCLTELNLLNEWTRLYVIQYDIEENDFTQFQMVRELAEIELMLWRLNNNLAKPEHAPLVQDVNVGVDKKGNVLTRQETNAFFEAKERLNARKSRLIKLMVGDRQEQYKREAALKQKQTGDPASQAAELRRNITAAMDQFKQLDREVARKTAIEADYVSPDSLSPEDLISQSLDEKE